jgi:hypothetical protein
MPIGLLRFALPLIIAAVILIVAFRLAEQHFEYKDNKDERRHKERLERERRDYETLMEYAENDELEQELREERQRND